MPLKRGYGRRRPPRKSTGPRPKGKVPARKAPRRVTTLKKVGKTVGGAVSNLIKKHKTNQERIQRKYPLYRKRK